MGSRGMPLGCVLLAIGGCTFGGYDDSVVSSVGDGGTGSATIDVSGGTAKSSDGNFTIKFGPGALNVAAVVKITEANSGGGPQFYSTEYDVAIYRTAAGGNNGPTPQLVKPAIVTFKAGNANVPTDELFFFDKLVGKTLSGGFTAIGGDLYGIAEISNGPTIGQFALEHVTATVPAATACGCSDPTCGTSCSKSAGCGGGACQCSSGGPNTKTSADTCYADTCKPTQNDDVCGSCFRACCKPALSPTGNHGPACYCANVDKSECMRTCVESGKRGGCQ